MMVTQRSKGLFGSRTRERILKLLGLLEQSYPRELATVLDEDLSVVQRAVDDLERDGILASRLMGRTRLFELNRTYQHYVPVRDLLARMGQNDPETVAAASRLRRRPRRAGKEL
ncbi:MAG TPA: winged helix-turn-helix domain-containing protein [Candidatus Elarobacter sp.]|jgi:DNA-binding transcriptional ArsR family regulator|nr:winged helix-turn-helix domain-containing protein [Candidatus Elarobacter sp.]